MTSSIVCTLVNVFKINCLALTYSDIPVNPPKILNKIYLLFIITQLSVLKIV